MCGGLCSKPTLRNPTFWGDLMSEQCEHYWARRRDGRRCVYCGLSEFGPQDFARGEDGVQLVKPGTPLADETTETGPGTKED